MQIVKMALCPGCQYDIRVSVKQLPRGLYTVIFFDGRDKKGRAQTKICPHCRIDLLQSATLKTLTGVEAAQLGS